ncbi:MAG: cellulase family glycosylhydrolase [Verrucomicrobiaceae bacterium]|nr:cellulase family glycosylhydrolase [Verrucomicrobiaceae bacterium]
MFTSFRILLTLLFATWLPVPSTSALEPVRVSRDGQSFVLAGSGRPFRVWGVNYDHDSEGENGRLIEDYWHDEWEVVRADFREMRDLGANVVRVHLQLGRFMSGPDKADEKSLAQLRKLLALAEETGLYLDLTGLGCYHKADTPPWYDAMDAPARWQVQARFWAAIARACRESPAVFCYDLMNEPVIGGKKEEGWLAGELGGKHFVQRIAHAPAPRTNIEVAKEWSALLTKAIRAEDPAHLITVGVIPWAHTWPGAKPVFYAPEVTDVFDFVSIHLYPEKGGVEKALAALAVYDLGKPLVIEETFPLNCTIEEMDEFLKKSRARAEGHVSFYWGRTIEELSSATEKKEIAALIAKWFSYFRDQAEAMKRPLDPKAGRKGRE